MSEPTGPSSRRSFLQWACAAAAAPVLARVSSPAHAQTTETQQLAQGGTPPAGQPHRIITANILLASDAHEGKPAAWSNRRDACIHVLRSHNPDIICMQEVLRVQADDLATAFSGYHSFGFPGPYMDAHPTGYHRVTKNVLLFRTGRYDLVSAGGFWLSETPLIAGSVSWDAMRARHVNWVRLRDRVSRQEFRVINTHFDHKGQVARENQARMINEEAGQYLPEFPQILAGDLNAKPDNPAIAALENAGWVETHQAVHAKRTGATFRGLEGKPAGPNEPAGLPIDYVFTRGKIKATAAAVLHDSVNGVFPSDHYFVMADVVIG